MSPNTSRECSESVNNYNQSKSLQDRHKSFITLGTDYYYGITIL
jgi:hypothetical protein